MTRRRFHNITDEMFRQQAAEKYSRVIKYSPFQWP